MSWFIMSEILTEYAQLFIDLGIEHESDEFKYTVYLDWQNTISNLPASAEFYLNLYLV